MHNGVISGKYGSPMRDLYSRGMWELIGAQGRFQGSKEGERVEEGDVHGRLPGGADS